MEPQPLKVGLTGGFSCGKTLVAEFLKEFDAPVIDVDRAGHWAIARQSVQSQIREGFGPDVFKENGNIDRAKLGKMVFANRDLLDRLNRIVHPVMIERVRVLLERALRYPDTGPYVVVDAALIYELNLNEELDYVITVLAPIERCVQWAKKRNHLNEDQVMQRIRMQIPMHEKARRSDYVIHNNGSLMDLKEKVKDLNNWLLQRYHSKY